MSAPTIGTFVKPVGRFGYAYCLEIMKVVTYEAWTGECVQW